MSHYLELVINSERLRIESIADASSIPFESVIEVLSKKVTEYLPLDWQVSDRDEAVRWLECRISEGTLCSICTKDSSTLVGFLVLHAMENSNAKSEVRIGYVIAEKIWGKGVGSELIGALVDCFKERGDASSLVGGVAKDNIASVKVLTKNGFQFSGNEMDTDFYTYYF